MPKDIEPRIINLHPLFLDIEKLYYSFWLFSYLLTNPNCIDIIKKNKSQFLNNMFSVYERSTKRKTEIDYLNKRYYSKARKKDEAVLLGKTMAILMFDYIKSSKEQEILKGLEELRFLGLVRNGAAHYNKFNLRDEQGMWKLRKKEKVKWKDKEINRDCQGKNVFDEFVDFDDMVSLAEFFSKKLKQKY